MPMRITRDQLVELEADRLPAHEEELERTAASLARANIDVERVIDEVARFTVAAPSWAVGTGGTRFGRFPIGGEPRTTEEKIDDVAALNALTGANRTVSLHVPWDNPADPAALRGHAEAAGIAFDAMNSNTFQDNPSTTGDGAVSYKFGSLANADPDVRKRALEHNRAVIDLGLQLGATALTVWLADGTNHPGQANFRRQFERVAAGLRELHHSLPNDWEMYTEHKPYEPAFYSSVNADWGSSLLLAQHAGPRTKCLVVLELLDTGAGALPPVRYMIDASHNLKDPLEDLIQATDQVQFTLAQALLVDRDALADAQDGNDPARAAEVLQAAYRSDVRPLVAEARRRNGAALAPLVTYRRLGYRAATVAARGEESVASGL